MDKNGIKFHKDLLCTITICTFASEKKEIQAISFSKSGKGLYSYKDNKLGLKKIGYKRLKKIMTIDYATVFMLLMVAASTACGIASIIHNNLR